MEGVYSPRNDPDPEMIPNPEIRGGWQRGLEPSLHDRPSYEIRPSETEYKFSLKTNMAENADMEGR